MAMIMVVDDNQRSLLLLRTFFQIEGFDVLTAENGDAALEMLKGDIPDVLVLDSQMPGLTGIQLLRKIREDARLKALPVVLCTGHYDQQQEAIEAGADSFIVKPYSPAELRDVVIELVAKQKHPRR